MRTSRWCGLLVAWACGGGPAAAPAPRTTPYDSAVGLATFEAAWRIVRDTHFDTTLNGVPWAAVRNELRPRAAAAGTQAALRSVVENMLARLGQSHFSLIPREVADPLDPDRAGAAPGDTSGPGGTGESRDRRLETGDLGLDTRLVGDELVVTTVEPGGPAAGAEIGTGWTVVEIDGVPVARWLERIRETERRRSPAFVLWSVAQARMAGPVGSASRLTVRDGAGRERSLTLQRRAQPSEPVKFGSLPTFFSRFASREVQTPAGRRVGVVWFNFWMVPLVRQVDSAMDAYRGLHGVVVDLRGNRGGLAVMIVGVAGHFVDRRDTLGTFQTRRTALQIVANPRRVSQAGERVTPFAGPVAILIDEGSASASEVFAGGLQALGRARVFGTASAGAVLPALWDRLPNGDVLYHAIAEFVTARGERLEGSGVAPDEVVSLNRDDLLAGRDPVLDAALRWIDGQ